MVRLFHMQMLAKANQTHCYKHGSEFRGLHCKKLIMQSECEQGLKSQRNVFKNHGSHNTRVVMC